MDEREICECKYSGEPVYAWSTVAVFSNGDVVLCEYLYEYMREQAEPKIMEGWELENA
jgi:hypothetical protein